jgi:general secretion pathway protein M
MIHSVSDLPNGRRGQALALGISVVVLAVAWVGLASPILGWYGQRQDRLLQRETMAGHMAALADTAPALQRQVAAGSGDGRATLVEGATEAIAGAVLQQRLQEISERAGVRMTSAEVLATDSAGAYRRIRVHVAVSGPWARLIRLLSDLGQASPSMSVAEMQIGQSRSITTDPVKPLDVSFTAVALYAGRSPAK